MLVPFRGGVHGRAYARDSSGTVFFCQLLLIVLPAVAWAFYLKRALVLDASRNLLVVMSDAGGAGVQLRLLQWLSFFRWEITLLFVALPALLLALCRFRIWGFLKLLTATLSILVIVVLSVQFEAYVLLRMFQSLELLQEAYDWGMRAGRAYEFISAKAVVRFVVPVAAVVFFALLPQRYYEGGVALFGRRRALGVAAAAGVLGFAIVSWLPWAQTTRLHSPAFAQAFLALFPPSFNTEHEELGKLPFEELRRRFEAATDTPDRLARSDMLKGAAKGNDVILIVVETLPTAIAHLGGDLVDYPNLRRLRTRAIISDQHYTTNPSSILSIFSILTSLYPPNSGLRQQLLNAPIFLKASFVKGLSAAGYRSGVYGSPEAIVPTARMTFERLGFERVLDFPASEKTGNEGKPGASRYGSASWLSKQLRQDRNSLKAMIQDIREWHQRDERYLALYLPQIGHEPWLDIDPQNPASDFWARGRNLLKLQDEWVGELLQELEAAGRLDRTIIVVTGDHGLRLPGTPGMRSDESTMRDHTFRVPLLIHAPAAVGSTLELTWPTSHIDIAPTVLELLGVEAGRLHEQGRSVWDERLTSRRVYFLASAYLGADGFLRKGEFFAWDRYADIMYRNTQMLFRSEHVYKGGMADSDDIARHLTYLDALRSTWFRAQPENVVSSRKAR